MYRNFSLLFFAGLLSITFGVFGQGTGNNPYSAIGIGDLENNYGSVRNIGMGSTGISARNHQFINFLNPALLGNNKGIRLDSTVKMEYAGTAQFRGLNAPSGSETSQGVNIQYFSLFFPVSKVWGTAIGLQPYSAVQYDISYSKTVTGGATGDTANYQNSGHGGLYKLFFSNGVGLSKTISVGLEASYLFGNITESVSAALPSAGITNEGFKQITSYSNLYLKPGIRYRKELYKTIVDTVRTYDSISFENKVFVKIYKKPTGIFVNGAFTCDYNSAAKIQQSTSLYNVSVNNIVVLDTAVTTKKYAASLPPSFRFGLSIDKFMKWNIAADISYAAWSKFNPGYTANQLGDSYTVALGGEFTPGELKLKSRTYRLGFSYTKSPIVIEGKQLNDISVSLGATVPFGRRATSMSAILPKVNIAIVVGQRGNNVAGTITEQYVKAFVSVLINDKWFNKRKIY